jgi:hypothetical protein
VIESVSRLKYTVLKRVLEEDTKLISDIDQISEHSAYEGIIALGKDVLPYILEDLQKGIDQPGFPGWWFMRAMAEISGETPDMGEHVQHAHGFAQVSVEGVANNWIEWGRKKGLIV